MNVGAVGAVGSGAAPVYAALSPYLNGVVRTSDAAAAATLADSAASAGAAATAAAVAAGSAAADDVTAAPPFANPAIADIAQRIALGQALPQPDALLDTPTAPAPPQPTPAESVLYGDSGLLIQSYGAVALAAGVQTVPPAFLQAPEPVIPAPAAVAAVPRLAKVS